MEAGIAEAIDAAASSDIADCFGTAEDIVAAADFRSLIDSCQCFDHIQNYWCFEVGNFLHHDLMHPLDHEMNHALHGPVRRLVLLYYWIDWVLLVVMKMLLLVEAEAVVEKKIRP